MSATGRTSPCIKIYLSERARVVSLALCILLLAPFNVLAQGNPFASKQTTWLKLSPQWREKNQCSFDFLSSPNEQNRNVDSNHLRLTNYWAQEAIGLFEVKTWLKTNQRSLKKVPIGVVDSDYPAPFFETYKDAFAFSQTELREFSRRTRLAADGFHHAAAVMAVMSDPLQGVAPNIRFVFLIDGETNQVLKNRVRPRLINRSMSYSSINRATYDSIFQDLAASLPDGKTAPLLINSGGNGSTQDFLTAGGQGFAHSHLIDAIFVAASTASGRKASYSGYGPNIFINAPAGESAPLRGELKNELLVPLNFSQNLNERTFPGTSAAAPQVTGSLALALGLAPQLTNDHLKKLLQKTRIFSHQHSTPETTLHSGTVNAYQIIRVADRLKHIKAPAKVTVALNALSTFDFSREVTAHVQSVEKKLKNTQSPTCLDRIALLKQLRQAFFLDPNHVGVRTALGILYRASGYEAQSVYYSPSQVMAMPIDVQNGLGELRLSKASHLEELARALSYGQLILKFDARMVQNTVQSFLGLEAQAPKAYRRFVRLLKSKWVQYHWHNNVSGLLFTLDNFDWSQNPDFAHALYTVYYPGSFERAPDDEIFKAYRLFSSSWSYNQFQTFWKQNPIKSDSRLLVKALDLIYYSVDTLDDLEKKQLADQERSWSAIEYQKLKIALKL